MNTKQMMPRYHTDEYDRFVLIEKNRDVTAMKAHQNKLMASMRTRFADFM